MPRLSFIRFLARRAFGWMLRVAVALLISSMFFFWLATMMPVSPGGDCFTPCPPRHTYWDPWRGFVSDPLPTEGPLYRHIP